LLYLCWGFDFTGMVVWWLCFRWWLVRVSRSGLWLGRGGGWLSW
jgi:hypothetical protein